jgi:hypothetical protein
VSSSTYLGDPSAYFQGALMNPNQEGNVYYHFQNYGSTVQGILVIQPLSAVPTLSQWGIIILMLLLATVSLRIYSTESVRVVMASAQNSMTTKSWNWVLYFKVLAGCILVIIMASFMTTAFFNPVETRDLIGMLICSILFSDMICQFLLRRTYY